MPRRSKLEGAWHNCTRCSRKTHLSEMKRERGILVCNRGSCEDTSFVGERDVAVAKAVAYQPPDEMMPHPVLTGDVISNDDIFFD